MLNELKDSKQLELLFKFKVLNHEERILDVELNGYVKNTEYSESFFGWFMEDLIFFLDANKFQRRWDYRLIKLHNVESLKLNNEQYEQFKSDMKTVTSWDMEIVDEDN